MTAIKIGDYVDFFPVGRMLQWCNLTVYRVVDITTDGDKELQLEYFENSESVITSVGGFMSIKQDGLFVLDYNIPDHKILIDRFNTVKMQSIIEM